MEYIGELDSSENLQGEGKFKFKEGREISIQNQGQNKFKFINEDDANEQEKE